jgi:flagellin
MKLLNAASTKYLQVGITSGTNDQLKASTFDCRSSALGVKASTNVASIDGAKKAMKAVDDAIKKVSETRGTFGVLQNRLDVTIDRLHTAEENLGAAESRIRDADIAAETSSMTRGQILMQSGVAMLAQANQLPGIAMSLIG